MVRIFYIIIILSLKIFGIIFSTPRNASNAHGTNLYWYILVLADKAEYYIVVTWNMDEVSVWVTVSDIFYFLHIFDCILRETRERRKACMLFVYVNMLDWWKDL